MQNSSTIHGVNFTDPLYSKQWHLKNNLGRLDCNVTGVWAHNITGRGVVVAVVDDGVEWTHPDLIDNYCEEGSFDLNSHDNDPSPVFDAKEENKHGTRCAGEIAAVPNSVCGVGIAYGSKFSGIRVLDGPTTDSTEATAFNKHMDVNDVYSCSWGPEDDGKTVDGPHDLGRAALQHGVVAGRSGFGSIYVVASGNGGDNKDNCNYDGYANSIYTITIGAVDEFGSKPSYAEECASMLACSVSSGSGLSRSIVTTDWSLHHSGHMEKACTTSHTGTSAATPLAAGMVALMLEARPCLSWRDVQHIIVMTATVVDDSSQWTKNKAGFFHSDIHGFGLLNAWRLVNAAKLWEPVPWMTSFTPDVSSYTNVVIPMGSSKPLVLKAYASIDECEGHMLATLEYVVFHVTLTHHTRGHLKYVLRCPSGTTSIIPTRPNDRSNDGLNEWTFSTVKCWGESPLGQYSLEIYDNTMILPAGKKLGILKDWKLILYGSQMTVSDVWSRKKLVENAMSGKFLLNETYTAKCPPGQYLDFDVTSVLSGRTIKLLAMLSCFLVFWAIYYSFEMALCNSEDKPKRDRSNIQREDNVDAEPNYGASSGSTQTLCSSSFHTNNTVVDSCLIEVGTDDKQFRNEDGLGQSTCS